MKAAAIDRFGGPAVLKIHRLPVPVPGPRDVLIAIDTAGVGTWDADMRKGWWPGGKAPFPRALGTDGSGIVAAAGSRVRRLKAGDRVYAYSLPNAKGGFYAERVAVPSTRAAVVPRRLDLERAGALATTGLTALQGVDDVLHVRKGESVIVLGATGGVGSLALQFAKSRGARVLAIASGKDGVSLARRLGADIAVDGKGKKEDFERAAVRFAPEGADAIIAFTGGKILTRCLDALRPGGRVAYPNGVEPRPRKRRGITIRSYDSATGVREFQRLGRAVETARLVVPIAAAYPLSRAADAHRRLDRGHVLGRIVLRVRGNA